MIFVDQSGKRWKYIKVGSGLISTAVFVPIGALLLAGAFYSPNWSAINVPKVLSSSVRNTDKRQTASPAAAPKKSNTGSNKSTNSAQSPSGSTTSANVQGATPAVKTTAKTTSPTGTTTSQTGTTTTTTDPATATTTTTTTPTSNGQGTPPADPGSKDYGQSHKPVTP